MHSLTSEGWPIKFYSCFLSYTEADDTISERLHNDLRGRGIRAWRWKDDAKWGSPLMRQVAQAIRLHDKLVVILSESSLKAEPVIREIKRALQEQAKRRKDVLFPIRIDDAIFSWDHELQADVTDIYIGDFTDWTDPDKYRKSLDRLIAGLQAEEPAQPD